MKKITARDSIGKFERERFERAVLMNNQWASLKRDTNGDYADAVIDEAWRIHCEFLEDMRTW